MVDGLKSGKDALSKLQQVLKLDDIENLMDDTRDAVQLQQQIEDTLAGVSFYARFLLDCFDLEHYFDFYSRRIFSSLTFLSDLNCAHSEIKSLKTGCKRRQCIVRVVVNARDSEIREDEV